MPQAILTTGNRIWVMEYLEILKRRTGKQQNKDVFLVGFLLGLVLGIPLGVRLVAFNQFSLLVVSIILLSFLLGRKYAPAVLARNPKEYYSKGFWLKCAWTTTAWAYAAVAAVFIFHFGVVVYQLFQLVALIKEIGADAPQMLLTLLGIVL